MAFVTDRKRALGLGSAKTGTEHHWQMMVSSTALLILCPLFIFTFGHALGMSYEDALAYYARPFPAIVGVLTMLTGWLHFRSGVQVLIEDYTHGLTRKGLILVTTFISYAAAASGVIALARIAF